MRRLASAIGAAMLAVAGAAAPAPAQEDGGGGLPPGDGRETVYAICSGCHSVRLVAQQGMSRERWDETLVWMVEKQGMPKLDPETREVVLDYLSAHLGVDRERPGAPSPFNRPAPLAPQ